MPNPIDFNSLQAKLSSSAIIAVVIGLLIFDGFTLIPAGHSGVIFDNGRGILEKEFPEGLHLKVPIWQKVYLMDMRTQEYTMSATKGEGAYKMSDDSIKARSRDGQIVYIDATILYHIEPNQAHYIRQNIGNNTEYQSKIVRPKSREILRDAVSKYDALDLVSDKRAEVVKVMNETLTSNFVKNKIVLEDVILRNVAFSEEFANAIEQKQVQFQKIKIAEYQKQEAKELKEKKIIEAQADAESISLKGDSLRKNPEVIQFEFVQKLAPNINWGILPDGITPILNIDK